MVHVFGRPFGQGPTETSATGLTNVGTAGTIVKCATRTMDTVTTYAKWTVGVGDAPAVLRTCLSRASSAGYRTGVVSAKAGEEALVARERSSCVP